MARRELDLTLVVVTSLVLVAVILALPSATAVRIILGLPFILFFPGYALVAALFPRKSDLDLIERIALSLGLSIAIVPLIGLALNYSPWGIQLDPILAFVTLFIVLCATAAWLRRRILPEDHAFGLTIQMRLAALAPRRLADRLFAATMIIALVGLGVTAYFVATSEGNSEHFTEFYVLGSGGKAEGYPTQVAVGEGAEVILGVVNHEGEDTTYRIEIIVDGEGVQSRDNLELGDGETWEEAAAIVPTHAGKDQRVEFLLYKGGGSELYRSLHIQVDVE